MKNNKIICVVGPTASGKTSLAINIAREIGGEIVCADSMQVYKELDIATAKPTLDEINAVPHHLFDFLEVDDEFSVAKYVKMADETIADIKNRGKIPVITGGTGLYIDSLIRGNDFAKNDDKNDEIREKFKRISAEKGKEYLHSLLKDIDAESYEKLHYNDEKRVIRALEVYEITGDTISVHNEKTKKIPSKYDALMFAIMPNDREVLYERINKRVDIMVQKGLVLEAEKFLKNEKTCKTAMGAIGYKELLPYFDGRATLEECIDKIKQETRRYAKRQLTWFRRNEQINWLDTISDEETLKNQAISIIKERNYV